MRIIDKYFLRQLILVFVMLLLVLTGLAWMVQIMSMMKFLLNYGVAVSSFLSLTSMMIPFIISIIIPFVIFIAVIFVYNRLITDNEVSVMMASTLSPRQIARPALWLAGVLTAAHLILNLFIVPSTQSKFYDTQWNLRYGLAHLKLQESAFTELSHGMVVYVDKVSGHDLSKIMLADTRNPKSEMIIFAERGKLVSTPRGLSIVMTNGSLQTNGRTSAIGTFDSFDMNLNMVDKGGDSGFRVRRMSTYELLANVFDNDTAKRHKTVLSELATRLLGPIMNLILVAMCLLILLRTSLLRRRASFAPVLSVAVMAASMAAFMSATNMLTSLTDLMLLTIGVFAYLGTALVLLIKK